MPAECITGRLVTAGSPISVPATKEKKTVLRRRSKKRDLYSTNSMASTAFVPSLQKMPKPPRAPRTPRSPRTPRGGSPRRSRSAMEYDAGLDGHQQTYVLSHAMMNTLQKTMMGSSGKSFTSPGDKIGFHGPRKPLLLSYPTAPSNLGRVIYVNRYSPRQSRSRSPGRRNVSGTPDQPHGTLPEPNKESKEFMRLSYNLRSNEANEQFPGWKKLPQAKTIAPPPTKTEKLIKEKGFILDGIALSNIQDDFAKVQPKLGPAIPPYNSHFDKHVQSYFTYKGLDSTLAKTMQTRERSESLQGRNVDRFHNIGVGFEYLSRRNRSGAGYSRDLVDGHDQFLSEARPMSSYNGRYGFRRNTPLLRNCPSPFGLASRSSPF
uniref:Uncharacterized LOC100177420 n=1 Tax=Ciona intestinalis TaxID=7719 RepID=F6YTH3_CIOIN|nr:uncharacterized protein LOC100177420 [Ciona intestinalis]|eukprot:XP_002129477.1 uncharacterized protein LOC100177420 [Ciona intestinalis]